MATFSTVFLPVFPFLKGERKCFRHTEHVLKNNFSRSRCFQCVLGFDICVTVIRTDIESPHVDLDPLLSSMMDSTCQSIKYSNRNGHRYNRR